MLLLSRSVGSSSLWLEGLRHTRLLCLPRSPGSLRKLMSFESVMLSNHLTLCLLRLLPLIVPSISVFSNRLALRIRRPKWEIIADSPVAQLSQASQTRVRNRETPVPSSL